MQGWMEKSLSAGGKEVLIKSVAQAIPTYSMACFKLPRSMSAHQRFVEEILVGIKERRKKDSMGILGCNVTT